MFAEELKKARNIYDIMAISYMHILNEVESKDTNLKSNDVSIKQLLAKYIEDKVSIPCKAFIDLKRGLTTLYMMNKFSSSDFYELLIEIDCHVIYNYRGSSLSDDAFITYPSLNICYNDNIKIFPMLLVNYKEQLGKTYLNIYQQNYLRDKKSYDTLSINAKLKNYIIYSSKKYNIFVHELIEYQDFTKQINDKKALNIALFPITSINIHDILNVKYTSDKHFSIDGIKSEMESLLEKRCKKFIENLDDNIDILIFPEMLMTESIVSSIKGAVKEKKLPFTFCGSVWKNKDNVCPVLYEGEEIFRYFKKIPFDLKYDKMEFQKIVDKCKNAGQKSLLIKMLQEHDFKEKIVFQESLKEEFSIHLIDINKFGRIITFICRDIDDDSYMDTAKVLQGDFIVLPACSPSNDLISGAATLSERYHYTTVMCNTCSGMCKNKSSLENKIIKKENIGFIVTPSKDDTSRSHRKTFYSFNEDCKNCEMQCPGYIFTVDMEELFQDISTVALNITEIDRR